MPAAPPRHDDVWVSILRSLLDFYLGHAGVLFAVSAATALVAEKIWRASKRRDLEWASTLTSLASAGAFLAAKTVVGKVLWLGVALWLYS